MFSRFFQLVLLCFPFVVFVVVILVLVAFFLRIHSFRMMAAWRGVAARHLSRAREASRRMAEGGLEKDLMFLIEAFNLDRVRM